MTTLEEMRPRVASLLKDAGNLIWTTDELDDALRLALQQLSCALPARACATLDAPDGQCEVDLSALRAAGLTEVIEVWRPYDEEHETYRRPHPVRWRMLDATTLLLGDGGPPAGGATGVRVFYAAAQTLAGLDGATATTPDARTLAALVVGAAGYAALSKARHVLGQVTAGAGTAQQYAAWAQARLAEFHQTVEGLAAERNAAESVAVVWRD